MNPERWQQIEEVLQATLDRPPRERAAFLDEACAGDDELKNEASSLVRALDEAGDFIEQPAIAQDARVLANGLPDANVGRAVGPYSIIERLGAGGMGEVYLAQDARLGRLVALKILPSYFVSDAARLRRFQTEARAASGLNHPNILTIHEVGEVEGVHFIATEFIDGQTIRELIAGQRLSLEEVLDVAAQVASGLAAAHAAGIVHRDIKPENIMRRTDGIVKILDFGIAKLLEHPTREFSDNAATDAKAQTETGVVMGTVGYMSPEQARGLPVDERTDIWSLGCVLYEMLARRAPFAGATRLDTLVAILEREPPALIPLTKDAPAPSPRIERIVARTLRKERSERYETVTEMLADLRSARQELDRASMLEAQPVPPSSPVAHARESRDETSNASSSDPSAPLRNPSASSRNPSASVLNPSASVSGSPTASVLASSAHDATTRRMVSRTPLFATLVAAALLLSALTGIFFYRRSSMRLDDGAAGATTTNAPPAGSTSNALTPPTKLYARMSEAEQLAFIDEQEQRISALMGERPARLDEDALRAIKRRVDAYVARTGSTSNAPGKDDLRVIFARATPHVPLIARSFEARKVPVIVGIYLPMIESEYRECLESSMGAKGMFQFLPRTAQLYGVAPEDMCNTEKMTPAAAHYIADRMAELGDDSQSMTLVVLSYNRGAEGVRNSLRRLRDAGDFERNFWTLYAHRDQLDDVFGDENAAYVPLFFAAAIIGENPQTFELPTPPLSSLTRPGRPVVSRTVLTKSGQRFIMARSLNTVQGLSPNG